jgi:hypothetical protein
LSGCVFPIGLATGATTIVDAFQVDRFEPGQPAPTAGWYDEHNPLGSRTGVAIMAEKGRALPRLPRGYFWRFKPASLDDAG